MKWQFNRSYFITFCRLPTLDIAQKMLPPSSYMLGNDFLMNAHAPYFW